MLDQKGMQAIVSNNSEIDRLLDLLAGVPDKYTGEDLAEKEALDKVLREQRKKRPKRLRNN